MNVKVGKCRERQVESLKRSGHSHGHSHGQRNSWHSGAAGRNAADGKDGHGGRAGRPETVPGCPLLSRDTAALGGWMRGDPA